MSILYVNLVCDEGFPSLVLTPRPIELGRVRKNGLGALGRRYGRGRWCSSLSRRLRHLGGLSLGEGILQGSDLSLVAFLHSMHLLLLLAIKACIHWGIWDSSWAISCIWGILLGHLVQSLGDPGAKPVPATVVVSGQGETFPSLPSVDSCVGWGDLPFSLPWYSVREKGPGAEPVPATYAFREGSGVEPLSRDRVRP